MTKDDIKIDENAINKELDEIDITEDQKKQIVNNPKKMLKLMMVCRKFCKRDMRLVMSDKDWYGKICPKCKKLIEGM